MTPQQLRVLLAVRNEGSMTAAARVLGYGVPTLAHHLTALERSLATRLVERDRRGTRLTALGLALADEASQILERLDRAERMVVAQRDAGLTTMRIATFTSGGSRLLPRALKALLLAFPVKIELLEASPFDALRLAQSGDVDVALLYDTADEPAPRLPDLVMRILVEEEFRLMVPGDSELAKREVIDMAEMAAVDWIRSRIPTDATERVLVRACHAAGFEPRILVRSDDLTMIHGLVGAGLGCALTTPAAADQRFPVALRPTLQPLGLRRTMLARAARNPPAAVMELERLLSKSEALIRVPG